LFFLGFVRLNSAAASGRLAPTDDHPGWQDSIRPPLMPHADSGEPLCASLARSSACQDRVCNHPADGQAGENYWDRRVSSRGSAVGCNDLV